MKAINAFLWLMVFAFMATVGLPAAGTQEAAETQKMVEISTNSYNMAPPEDDAWVLRYWEKQLGIKITYVYLENNRAEELLNLRFASGDEPDSWSIKGNTYSSLANYVDEGLIAEIPLDMLSEWAPGTKMALDAAGSEAWTAAKYNGKIYNLPTLRAHNLFPSPVIWRDDWLRNVGISTTPTTIDEAEQAFYAFRDNDPDGNGKKDTYALSETGINVIYGAFGYLPGLWSDKNGELVYGAIQPEMKEALALLAKWFEDGIVDPEFVTGENKGGYWALTHDFINSRIGFTNMGQYYHWKPPLYEGDFYGQDVKEFEAANADGSYIFGKALVGPGGRSGTSKGALAAPGRVFASRLENDLEKFGKVLQLFDRANTTQDGYLLSYYGEEGVHWNMVDGKPVATEEYRTPEAQARIGGHTILAATSPLDFMWINYVGWKEWAEERIDMDHYYVNELKSPLPSAAEYMAELEKLQQETYVDIITGGKPVSAFDDFVATWKKEGGDILTQEANAWYASTK